MKLTSIMQTSKHCNALCLLCFSGAWLYQVVFRPLIEGSGFVGGVPFASPVESRSFYSGRRVCKHSSDLPVLGSSVSRCLLLKWTLLFKYVQMVSWYSYMVEVAGGNPLGLIGLKSLSWPSCVILAMWCFVWSRLGPVGRYCRAFAGSHFCTARADTLCTPLLSAVRGRIVWLNCLFLNRVFSAFINLFSS